MTAQHTPGPWRIEGRMVSALKEKWICEIAGNGIRHGRADKANARLIAAAPDLLEALCKLAQLYDAMDVPRGPCRIMADAAIAKATGGAA